MRRSIAIILFLVIVALAASFSYLNPQQVDVDYLFGEQRLGLPWLLFLTMVTGWLLGVLSMLGILLRLLADRRRLRRSVHLAEMEIDNLRSIPIRDAH